MEPEVLKPLAEAQREVLAAVEPLAVKATSIWEARGLVLAQDVTAPHDVPPFTNSAMDGFAVRAADVADAPVTLRVVEGVAAGHVAEATVGPGEAIQIMTGAPLPAGADTVVKVEDTETVAGGVRILAKAGEGTAVRPAGGDVGAGALVFEAGTRLGPAHLGVLASLGISEAPVRRRPRVALLSTGDEVQPPEAPELQPGQIRDSNRPMLSGLLAEVGARVLNLGIVPDDAGRLQGTLEQAADDSDLVITSGGVSMGEHDLVKAVLQDLGEIDFWKVAMQPAKPFAFGKLAGVPFFGLPGNPVSVMVAFEQFARPAILHMMGSRRLFRPRVSARMLHEVRTSPEKTVFLRVKTRRANGGLVAELSGGQSSNVLTALAGADALAVIPIGVETVEAGAEVELEMFTWPEERSYAEVLGSAL